MNPTVHLELAAGVIRIYPEGLTFPHDHYNWSATAVRVKPGVLEIMGATRAPTPDEFRALRRDLTAMGYTKVVFSRHRENGSQETHEAVS